MRNLLLSLWYKYKDWQYERKCLKHLGMKPQKMYVSKEAYDALVEAINKPPDPESVKRLKEILQKVPPWERDE